MSRPYLWSGSEAERALVCPASTALPRVEQVAGAAARGGKAVHLFLELCAPGSRPMTLEKRREAALAVIGERYPDDLDWCEAVPVDELPVELAHEVAFAFDCETGVARELGRGIDRDYVGAAAKLGKPLGRFEIPLTIDVLGIADGAVYVGDYKTGRSKITEAKRNGQLGLGALCAARVYRRDAAVVELIKPGHDGSKPYRDRAELDFLALDSIESAMLGWPARYLAAAQAVERGEHPEAVEGSHCKYCRSFTRCPAKLALAVRLGTGEEIAELQRSLTVDNAGAVYLRLKAAEDLLGKIRGVLYAFAAETPFEWSPGQWLGMHSKRGNEKLDGDAVHAVVELLHDRELADACVERSTTKTRIDAALKARGVKPRSKAKDAILERVRAHGGATRNQTEKVQEYST